MGDLRSELRDKLLGRVCLVGIGNPDLGDDGFGVRLAEEIQAAGYPEVIVAGTTPERWAGHLAQSGYGTVVFLDVVRIPAEPGAVAFLGAGDLTSKFPQLSTHKLSLGTLARLIESTSQAKVWLLGTQPKTLLPGSGLSGSVGTTLEALKALLCEVLSVRTAEPAVAGERA
ncbi:MAG TPA: hydrogenase maturation protease [Candidatus Acidoferrum sp.]|nr:hydrogenase maturation protease [Candidatus Acidoferrum sp.]